MKMSVIKRGNGYAVGVVVVALCLVFGGAVSEGAEEEFVERGRALTLSVCDGLVHGDVEPLLAQVMAGKMPRAASRVFAELVQLAPEGERGEGKLTRADWSQALAHWGTALKNGGCRATLARSDGEHAVFTARFETRVFDTSEKLWYLRFHYRAGRNGLVLENVDLPFMGADLSREVAERIFYERYGGEVKRPVDLKKRGRLVRMLLVIVAVVFIAKLLLRRRVTGARRRALWRNKGFLVAAMAVAVLMAYNFAKYTRKPQEQPVEDQGQKLFVDRILLKRRMIQARFADAEGLARGVLKLRAKDLTVQLHLAEALVGQKKTEEARLQLTPMVKAEDEVARAFARNQLALLDAGAGLHGAAAKHLLALRKIVGDDDAIVVRLADAFDHDGQAGEAKRALNLALKINPNSGAALLMRARFAVRRDDLDAAARDLLVLKERYGLNVYRLGDDLDFGRLKEDERYAELFSEK